MPSNIFLSRKNRGIRGPAGVWLQPRDAAYMGIRAHMNALIEPPGFTDKETGVKEGKPFICLRKELRQLV